MSEWRPIDSAPKDGTKVRVRVIYEFEAQWIDCLLDSDGRETGGWMAPNDDAPPCWTDGVCWELNECEVASIPPIEWKAVQPEGERS